jgi:dienelactone hydrolase
VNVVAILHSRAVAFSTRHGLQGQSVADASATVRFIGVAILWVPIDFYYPEFWPGRKIFGHWLEYNEEAAADATRRMREFLKRHLS